MLSFLLLAALQAPMVEAAPADSSPVEHAAKKKKPKSKEKDKGPGGGPLASPEGGEATPKADRPERRAPAPDERAPRDAGPSTAPERAPVDRAPAREPGAPSDPATPPVDRAPAREPGAPSDPATPTDRSDTRTPVDRAPAERSSADRGTSERHEAAVRRPVHAEADHTRSRVPYEGHREATHRPYQSRDHRYAHPHPRHTRAYEDHRRPSHSWYRPWYTHWWVHPYYRWVHTTWVVVSFPYAVDPWADAWAPPPRAEWVWVSGHWEGRAWVPGHWQPVRTAPAWYGASWVWVPGFWVGNGYVEGYWRVDRRPDGAWEWVPGHYVGGGAYVSGHWRPTAPPPSGYTWEPGFWDGEDWVEGFWRPASRSGYRWVDGRYVEDGTYQAGYWEPTEPRPGFVWIPGWFDGEVWVQGYWVSEAEYTATDTQAWTPPEGVEDGWDQASAPAPESAPQGEEIPLALPVDGAR